MATPLKYPTSVNATQKTLGAALLTGATAAVTLNSVTGIQDKAGVFVVDRVDANGTATASAREYITFTGVSGSTLTGLTRNADGGGTDQDHAVGAIVEFVSDILQEQAIIDALLLTVTTAGALDTTKVVDLTTAQALSTKTLTTPVLASFYQDAGKTKLMTTPDTASDTLVAIAATQVLTNKTLTSPVLRGTVDGWIEANETWTYASASTFTIATFDATSKYQAGDKLKLTQTTAKYFYIASVVFDDPGSTITVVVDTTYTIANAAITLPFYSRSVLPFGFPDYFQNAKARAYLGTDQDDLTDATWTKVALDSETYDPGSNFASGDFVAPISGYYSIKWGVYWEGTDLVADKRYSGGVYVNNALVVSRQLHSSVSDFLSTGGSDIVSVVAGQEVELWARSGSGANTADVNSGESLTYLTVDLVSL